MATSPITMAIDKACGYTPEMQAKHAEEQRNRDAIERRRQNAMTTLLIAVENWYHDESGRTRRALRKAWVAVCNADGASKSPT
jgi:hypothetical protein